MHLSSSPLYGGLWQRLIILFFNEISVLSLEEVGHWKTETVRHHVLIDLRGEYLGWDFIPLDITLGYCGFHYGFISFLVYDLGWRQIRFGDFISRSPALWEWDIFCNAVLRFVLTSWYQPNETVVSGAFTQLLFWGWKLLSILSQICIPKNLFIRQNQPWMTCILILIHN